MVPGEQRLEQLRSEAQLGAVVVVDLSTNGPITDTDFDDMMAILTGAARVVFVTVHVDRDWQDPNNAVLAAGVARYPAPCSPTYASLGAAHPDWFGFRWHASADRRHGSPGPAALMAGYV